MTEQATAADLELVRHMLGITEGRRRGYRNYFVAGGDDIAAMERLRAAGLVVKNNRHDHFTVSPDPLYHATLKGARAVGLTRLPS